MKKEDLNLVEILCVQAKWSNDTFGPGCRLEGLIDHIQKELDEVKRNPTDISEFIDIAVLAFDGAWRLLMYGLNVEGSRVGQLTAEAYWKKILLNMDRKWPDWRTAPKGKAIEHIRGCAACDRGDFQLGHADDCPKNPDNDPCSH